MQRYGKQTPAVRVFALILMALLAFGGCVSAQKKPLPVRPSPVVPPDRIPRTQVNPTPQRTPSNTAITAEFNGMVQAETGVKKSYTVVLGNVAITGIEIKTAGKITTSQDIRKRATQKLEADPRIVKAYVTTDTATTAEIKKIAEEINRGKPATDYMDRLKGIIQRIRSIQV